MMLLKLPIVHRLAN